MKKLVRFIVLILCGSIVLTMLSPRLLPWPGMLPDHPLYALKVVRNKLIPHLIYYSANKVEFDLLMANQLLHASKILFMKGKVALAKETALKGENYFSILVSDYGAVLAKKQKISKELNQKIIEGYENHAKIITYLIDHAQDEDKKTYQQVQYFSKTNFQSLQDLQEPKK